MTISHRLDEEILKHPIKCRVRSPNNCDIHKIILDDSKYSNQFYADYLWSLLSGGYDENSFALQANY